MEVMYRLVWMAELCQMSQTKLSDRILIGFDRFIYKRHLKYQNNNYESGHEHVNNCLNSLQCLHK